MKFREVMIAAAAALTMVVAMHPQAALADGPKSAYDGEQDLSLAPNEAVVSESTSNDDGAVEDPNHLMSPTARAFRNGLINGRQMQRDQDVRTAQVNVPPLPPGMPKGYAGYPRAAQVEAIPQPIPQWKPPVHYTQQPQQQYDPREYVESPQQYQQQYRPRPQPPVVVNVNPDPRYYEQSDPYGGRAPSWRNRMEAQQQYVPGPGDDGFSPQQWVNAQMGNEQPVYVQQQPVYQQPPVVYAPPPPPVYYAPQPPVVYVQPMGYVRRAAPAYYPYGGYTGISARIGRVRIGIGGYGY